MIWEDVDKRCGDSTEFMWIEYNDIYNVDNSINLM